MRIHFFKIRSIVISLIILFSIFFIIFILLLGRSGRIPTIICQSNTPWICEGEDFLLTIYGHKALTEDGINYVEKLKEKQVPFYEITDAVLVLEYQGEKKFYRFTIVDSPTVIGATACLYDEEILKEYYFVSAEFSVTAKFDGSQFKMVLELTNDPFFEKLGEETFVFFKETA